MWCRVGLKIAMGILKRMLPRLKERAGETRTPIDDAVIQAVEEVMALNEKGEIEKLLCGE